jgi:DNA repair exonuclease SbcCD ATPase subunit
LGEPANPGRIKSRQAGARSRAFTDAEFHDKIVKTSHARRPFPQFAEHFMPLFSERVSMLEVQNRALKKTARERAERIDDLERELRHRLQLANRYSEEHVSKLERDLEQVRQKAQHIERLESELQQKTRELEQVKAEREFYCKRAAELEEHNQAVTDAATKYSLWGQKLFSELATLDPDGAPRRKFDTGSWM